MTIKFGSSWRLRLIIIATGIAVGIIGKWIAGHYNSPGEAPPKDGDTPVRQVA